MWEESHFGRFSRCTTLHESISLTVSVTSIWCLKYKKKKKTKGRHYRFTSTTSNVRKRTISAPVDTRCSAIQISRFYLFLSLDFPLPSDPRDLSPRVIHRLAWTQFAWINTCPRSLTSLPHKSVIIRNDWNKLQFTQRDVLRTLKMLGNRTAEYRPPPHPISPPNLVALVVEMLQLTDRLGSTRRTTQLNPGHGPSKIKFLTIDYVREREVAFDNRYLRQFVDLNTEIIM